MDDLTLVSTVWIVGFGPIALSDNAERWLQASAGNPKRFRRKVKRLISAAELLCEIAYWNDEPIPWEF